ncbi:hypothetical protein PYCCODRAFT_1332083, partial [Trametes coccinea BRFM310]
QADDVLLLSYSLEGLQIKLDILTRWCARNGLRISVPKSYTLAFGELPVHLLPICLYDQPLRLVQTTPYVGISVTTSTKNIFSSHRKAQASKARRVANATLALESYIGPIPPDIAASLYMARVDPHLTYGCVVDPDVSEYDLLELEKVQNTFARRSFRLPKRAAPLPLLMELAIWPLRYRRVTLTLKFLLYLLSTDASVPTAALTSILSLAKAGHPCWYTDLKHALAALPVPVALDHRVAPTIEGVNLLLAAVRSSLLRHLQVAITSRDKLEFWRATVFPSVGGASASLDDILTIRPYYRNSSVEQARHIVRVL